MGQHQLAALIDNDAGGIIPESIVLHQPEGVAFDFLVVNRVPCADMAVHCHAGGILIDNRAFLFENRLLLLLFGDHRDGYDPVTNFGELLRHFELSHKLPQQFRRERAEAVIRQTGNKKCTGYNIIDFAVVIPQSAVERQAFQLTLFIADNGNRLCKRIDGLNAPADFML